MSDDIDIGQISEALNHKADLDLQNTQPYADYVIEWQTPNTSNNFTWYRLYKSGWLEQGGQNFATAAGVNTINLPKKFKNTQYTITSSILNDGTPVTLAYGQSVGDKAVDSFKYYCQSASDTGYNISWEARGIAKE